jgi:Raf kinase inhibitor-like YbhB/YbcL family protein
MDGNQQSGILSGLVWVVIIAALIIGGIYVYNNYSAETPVINGTNKNSTPPPPMATSTLSLRSTAFQHGGAIPAQFTCDGNNSSPPISWMGAPTSTQSFALIMDDPDVPKQLKPEGVFDHWTLFNIPATTTQIAASSTAGIAGANGAGKNAYTGPCPPPQYEPSEHRYFFRLYALDAMLNLQAGATKAQVLQAMQGHVLEEAELMGRYKRSATSQ